MKITIEFENPCELTALLVEIASKIEQSEDCCKPYEPMKPAQMAEALRSAINSKSPQPAMYTQSDETPISHDHTKVKK